MSLFDELKTLQDVQRLIDDGVREGDTIDYKRADAPLQDRAPVAKVVCAFANANGGVCIYGVETTKQDDRSLPVRIVPIDPANIARIRQAIATHVRHPVPGLRFRTLEDGGVPQILLVDVPASPLAPHMSTATHLYYRRADDQSVPMGHDLVELYFGRRGGPFLTPHFRGFNRHAGNASGRVVLEGVLTLRNDGASIAREMMVAFLEIPGVPLPGISGLSGWHFGTEHHTGLQIQRMFRTQGVLHCTDSVGVASVRVQLDATALTNLPKVRVATFAEGMRPAAWVLGARAGERVSEGELYVEPDA
jgi:hypothetical protein